MNDDPFARVLRVNPIQELGELLNKSLKKERPHFIDFLAKQERLNAKIKRSYPKPELVG